MALKETLIAASALTVMAGAAVSAALPSITLHFSHEPGAELLTKLIITLPAIFIAMFSAVMGWLADTRGKKQVLLFSLILYAAGGLSAIFSSSLFLLLCCRAILGVGVAGIATSVNAIVADRYKDEERNIFLSRQSSATALAGVVFISAGGWLASFGWQFPFMVYALSVPVVLLVRRTINEKQFSGSKSPAINNRGKFPRTVFLYYFLVFVSMTIFYMVPAQMPYLLMRTYNSSSLAAGLAISICILASAISAWNYSKLEKRFSTALLLLFAFVINGSGYLLISISGSYWFIVAALFVAGLGNGLLIPLLSNRVMQLAPTLLRGRVMGGFNAFLFIGQFLSPFLLLPVINYTGLQPAYGVVGAVVIIVAIPSFLLQNKIPATEPAGTGG